MNYQNENFNGTCDFRSNAHNGWLVGEHLHEYSEILFCQSGEGLATVNGQTILLRERQLLWIPPNYVHRYDFPNARVICAVFSNDLIPLFFKVLAGRYFCVRAIDAAELTELLERFPQLDRTDFLQISGYLNLVCAKVMRQSDFTNAGRTDGILYQKVISYLSEHYTENITLRQIAKKFGYNEKYLSHTLHDLTGIHFRQLLSFYRINHAKKMLESGVPTTISAIASESGFSALNTFNRVFKESVGSTPAEYRQNFSK